MNHNSVDPEPSANLQRFVSLERSTMMAWVILFTCLVLTVTAYVFSRAQERAHVEERFQFRATEIVDGIQVRIGLYEQALRSGAGLIRASDSVSRGEWHTFVDNLQMQTRLPGIRAMGYAAPLDAEDIPSYIASIHAEGFETAEIIPAGVRDFYAVVKYVEPFDWRNMRAFGYDMWSSDVRREALMRSRDTGEVATSGMVVLKQETEKSVQKGFLTYVPVYSSSNPPTTVKERQAALQGWVYGAFRVGEFMEGAWGQDNTGVTFEVYDGDQVGEDTLLFDSDQSLSLLSTFPQPAGRLTRPMILQGHHWTLVFMLPKNAPLNQQEARRSQVVLFGGIAINSMLLYVIASLYYIRRHGQRQALKLAREREQLQKSYAQQVLLVEAQELETSVFFELAPEAFLVVNNQGVIVKANRHAHQLFLYDHNALLGTSVELLIPESQREHHHALRQQFAAQPSSRIMNAGGYLDAVKQDGQLFPATVSLVPMEYRGEPHVVAAVHDISQQKEVENTLAKAKEEAEFSSRSKSEFVANMSHEIRTPLNAVLGAAQLLEKSRSESDYKKYVQMIRSSGEALLGIINDILDFSKIEAGAMELSPIRFDLNEVLSRVAIMMSVSCGEKDLELVIHVEPTVQRKITADPLRLQQVLINLVTNAVKFTQAGEVVLSIEADGPIIDGKQCLRFSVRDTGIGMNLNQQARLFKAFYQADASISRRFGGTGLGLVISSRIVTLMGSHLRLVSEPDIGSEFIFELTLPATNDIDERNLLTDKTKKTVLILDDHAQTCSSLSTIFSGWHWQVHSVSHWQNLETLSISPELLAQSNFILIDSHIDQQGAEFALTHLRAQGLNPHCVALLLVGSNHQAAIMLSAGQKHFDDILVKPIISSILLDVLNQASIHRAGQALLAAKDSHSQANAVLDGVRVLLVEDNPYNQTIAQGMLEDMGVQVETVNNGAEAIKKIQQFPNAFDAILMDIQMPVMDGVTATRYLRTECNFKRPIIALTAGVLKSEHDHYLAVGMDDLVPKPINCSDLFRALRNALPNQKVRTHSDPESNASATSVPASAHCVFNAERMEQLTRGKTKRIINLITSLRGVFDESETLLNQGFIAIQNADYPLARTLFHSVKGLVANYGADELAHAIKTLEEKLHSADKADDIVEINIAEIQMAMPHNLAEFRRSAEMWICEQQSRLDDGLSTKFLD